MKTTILYLTAAIAAGLGATPVVAQNSFQAWGRSPLTLEQEQIVSEIRDRDRQLFLRAADGADDIIKRDRRGHWFVKPISDWDQFDFEDFKEGYDFLVTRGDTPDTRTIGAIRNTLFWDLLSGRGADGGGDGAE